MASLKEIVDVQRKKKGYSAKILAEKIGMTEQGFHTMLRKNSTKFKTLEKLSEILDVPVTNLLNSNTEQKVEYSDSPKEPEGEHWKELVNQLMKEIGDLRIENWSLKKELGKFDTVHLSLSELVSAVA